MISEWKRIEDLKDFKEYYEFNSYVVVYNDGDNDCVTDIVFGIDQIPKGTVIFFCVPEPDEGLEEVIDEL